MIGEILSTGAKVRIMKLFSEFSSSDFQATDVARRIGLSVSRAGECLNELAKQGVLQSRRIGKGYIFRANTSNYLAKIIFDLFEKERGLATLIAKEFVMMMKNAKGIVSVVLFGSSVGGLRLGSDVDILVVSEQKIERESISGISAELTGKYGFPVVAIVMTVAELRRKIKERFVIGIMAGGVLVWGKGLEEVV